MTGGSPVIMNFLCFVSSPSQPKIYKKRYTIYNTGISIVTQKSQMDKTQVVNL